MALLAEFLLRLCFGLAAGMALVPPRQVTSGYFRNHLYVTLGLSALAALASRNACADVAPWALASAIASYAGSVCWLYERRRLGVAALYGTAALALIGAWVAEGPSAAATARSASQLPAMFASLPEPMRLMQTATSGLTLGVTMAAMLLGHWYLNAPGMDLAPLRRMLAAMGAAVAIHAVVCGSGLALEVWQQTPPNQWWWFVALRWLFGLAGVLGLISMAWQTLNIPNTQSATGILYVAVMGTFVGETMSLLLSAETMFPV